MGKVKQEYKVQTKHINLLVLWDVNDEEGYGVYLQDAEGCTSTVTFGHGELALYISELFFTATCKLVDITSNKCKSEDDFWEKFYQSWNDGWSVSNGDNEAIIQFIFSHRD